MPIIGVPKSVLDRRLGKSYNEDEFQDLCFDYGLELDEVTSEKEQIEKERGSGTAGKGVSEEVIYRVDLPANRYDLLCAEGLTRALLVFLQKEKIPEYKLKPAAQPQRLIIKAETQSVRPHAVAAVLRNLTLTPESYASLIDLQDKLHQNICRKRSLVAIGTHDLDNIQGPFIYTAKPPKDIKFRALSETAEHTAEQLMVKYSAPDHHLRHYLNIIREKPAYPVIYDQKGVVLSMPPIINGEHSKITLNTKNIFIEITATDLTKAKVVLDTVVTMFSEYCSQKFTIEPAEVEQVDGSVIMYPSLQYRYEHVPVDLVNSRVGVQLEGSKIASLLTRMCLQSEVVKDKSGQELIKARVPPTRHDILHPCDVIEDVAVGYGFNNIEEVMPAGPTIAAENELNKLTNHLRQELAACGYTEALTFSLVSREELSTKMRHDESELIDAAVHIGNPKTAEFQVARTSLLPGILKTLSYNRDMPLPLRLFEIQDCVLRDSTKDVGARNERKLCAVYYGKTSGFELIHGLLDRVMLLLGVPFTKDGHGYFIRGTSDPTYFDGRCAEVVGPNGVILGKLGVIHPEVIRGFDLTVPASALEINVEHFL